MPLLRDDDLVHIDLPEAGEWVKVKRRPSRGDRIAVQKAVLAGARVQSGQDWSLDAPQALEAAEFAALDIAIKQWSFHHPVTPEAIRTLDEPSVDLIKVRLNELWAPRTDDERGNSAENGATSGSEREAVPTGLDG